MVIVPPSNGPTIVNPPVVVPPVIVRPPSTSVTVNVDGPGEPVVVPSSPVEVTNNNGGGSATSSSSGTGGESTATGGGTVTAGPGTPNETTVNQSQEAESSATDDDSDQAADDEGDEEDGGEVAEQLRCTLRIKNATGERLTLWVQSCIETDDGDWEWLATGADDSETVFKYELNPGETRVLEADPASRELLETTLVRLWTETATGRKWTTYKDKDLWLVPEPYEDDEEQTVELVLTK